MKSMKWIPPFDWINFQETTFFTSSKWNQYIVCFYHSALLLGINEMGPVNGIEMAFCVGSLMLSLVVSTFLFGELAVVIFTMNKSKTIL